MIQLRARAAVWGTVPSIAVRVRAVLSANRKRCPARRKLDGAD